MNRWVTAGSRLHRIAAAYAGVLAAALRELLQANERHLTRHGDYRDAVTAPLEKHAADIAASDPRHNFGIYECDVLVGTVALAPVAPPRYGLGYLLAERACGRGIATLAVRAIVAHARAALGATDVFAGVTHGNRSSVAVLGRAGFSRVAVFDDYDRYHQDLTSPAAGAPECS